MWVPVALLRLLLMLPVLLTGALICLFIAHLSRGLQDRIVSTWHRVMLWCMGIRARYRGPAVTGPVLMVANHVSWADILVLGARWPFAFLAMAEVRRWPLVGWLAGRVGTLFIRRGEGASDALRQVAAVLREGRSAILFPEGRTTDGTRVARFHPRLLQAAVETGAPVQPVALGYQDRGSENGAPSRVTYADEAGFLEGLWRVISGPLIDVDVRVYPVVGPADDRQLLSREAHTAISSHPRFTARSQCPD